MHTNLLSTLNDASKPQPPPETLREDDIRCTSFPLAMLSRNFCNQFPEHDVELSALFTEAGYHSQIEHKINSLAGGEDMASL